MISFRKPDADAIDAFLARENRLALTCPAKMGEAGKTPAGYRLDHTRIELGRGRACFQAAREALENWRQFPAWVTVGRPSDEPHNGMPKVGNPVAIVARSLGLWWLNACRIVELVDEDGPIKRFGLTVGTLPCHAGRGQERFFVEWHRATDAVHFDVLALSRPHGPLVWIGYPWFRHVQRRFHRDSAKVMQREAIVNSA